MILKSIKKELRLKLGQDDDLCSTHQPRQHDHHFTIDMIEWQNTEKCLFARLEIQCIARPVTIQSMTHEDNVDHFADNSKSQ